MPVLYHKTAVRARYAQDTRKENIFLAGQRIRDECHPKLHLLPAVRIIQAYHFWYACFNEIRQCGVEDPTHRKPRRLTCGLPKQRLTKTNRVVEASGLNGHPQIKNEPVFVVFWRWWLLIVSLLFSLFFPFVLLLNYSQFCMLVKQYIGVDMAKNTFDACFSDELPVKTFANTESGLSRFFLSIQKILPLFHDTQKAMIEIGIESTRSSICEFWHSCLCRAKNERNRA